MKKGDTIIIPAARIDRAYVGLVNYMFHFAIEKGMENVAVMGIRNDGEVMLRHMVERYGINLPIGFIDNTNHRDDYREKVVLPKGSNEIPIDIEGKHVILIDSVCQTRRTARAAMSTVEDYGRPSSIKLAVLLERDGHELPIHPDYASIRDGQIPSELEAKLHADGRQHYMVLKRR